MKRNKIIAVAAVFAVGIVAWRMGAMQEAGPASAGSAASAQAEGPETITLLLGEKKERLVLPKAQWEMFPLIGVVIESTSSEDNEPIPMELISKSIFEAILKDIPWLKEVQERRQAGETEQQAAERIARAMPVVSFNEGRLNESIAKLRASIYLQQLALCERYAREIADMLSSDDSMKLLVVNDKYVQIINTLPVELKEKIRNYMPSLDWGEALTLRGHTNVVESAVFSPNGGRIVTASLDGTAKIWNANTGALEHTVHAGSPRWPTSAAFSPDGNRIVTTSTDGMVIIWDANTGAPLHELDGDMGIRSAVFSPNGSMIVAGSDAGMAIIWDANTGALEHMLSHSAVPISATFSPNGRKVVTASLDGTAKIWSATTGALEHTVHAGSPRWPTSAAFFPDGNRIVTVSSGMAKIWDANTGAPLHELRDPGIRSAVFSPDGSKIMTEPMVMDTKIKIWNANTGALEMLLGHPVGHAVLPLAAYSPDGSKIVDGAANIWNATTGQEECVLRGDIADLTSVIFSPDGSKILTKFSDRTARIFVQLPAQTFEQALLMLVSIWAQNHGKEAVWVSGWGREVMDTYSQKEKKLIKQIFPKDVSQKTKLRTIIGTPTIM